MTANQQEFQRQTELHCNTVNIVNTIINQNQEEVSSSSKIHEDNTELFVTDKNETKVMEELFDKLVAEESTPGLDKLVRSQSFDAVEKWLQNSSTHQDQTAGTIDTTKLLSAEVKNSKVILRIIFQFLQNSSKKARTVERAGKKWENNPKNNTAIFHFCTQCFWFDYYTYRISSYSFRGNYSFFNLKIQRSQFVRPKVTVHKTKGHIT